MIVASCNLRNNITTFECPNCGVEDAAYASMHDSCFNCGSVYTFNVDKLNEDIEERIYFHKNGVTTEFSGLR